MEEAEQTEKGRAQRQSERRGRGLKGVETMHI